MPNAVEYKWMSDKIKKEITAVTKNKLNTDVQNLIKLKNLNANIAKARKITTANEIEYLSINLVVYSAVKDTKIAVNFWLDKGWLYNDDCLKNLDTRGDINAAALSGADRLRVRVLRVIYEVCTALDGNEYIPVLRDVWGEKKLSVEFKDSSGDLLYDII